jgi:hypothetical protein
LTLPHGFRKGWSNEGERMTRRIAIFAPLALVAGCVAPSGPRPVAGPVMPQPHAVPGLEGVMGADARSLAQRLGRPDLDIREGAARKLQFSSAACVLDAYLYPQAAGAEPVVTHVDARLPDGRDIDRASCAAALIAQAQSR